MVRTAVANRVAQTRTGNILYNGGFEVKPSVITAATNTLNRWIDGTAAGSNAKLGYGWGVVSKAGTAEAGFDISVMRSGLASLKLSALDTAGTIVVASYKTNPGASSAFELFRLEPSTTYTLVAYMKTTNVVTDSAFIDLRQYRANITATTTTSTNKLSGTNGFTLVTLTITTNSDTVFGSILIRNNIAGNISNVWVDDMTLIPSTIGRIAASGRVAA